MPVRRRKYFEKNEGLVKCISSAICAAGLFVWRSSIWMRVMRARCIQSFGGSTTGLADNGGQVALGKAHAIGIVAYLVMLGTMLGDQLEEAVEDSLFARTTAGQLVGLLVEQMVVMLHLGSYEGCDGGTMIVVSDMNRLPDGVHNMCGCSDILFAGRQLGPIAQFAGWKSLQRSIPTGVMADSNVSRHKLTFENCL